MKYTVRSKKKYSFQLPRKADFNTSFEVKLENGPVQVRILETWPDGGLRSVMIDGRIFPVQIERRSDGFPGLVRLRGIEYDVDIEKVESTRYRPPATARKVSGSVKAELPGQVTAMLVAEGNEVKKGQVLAILEAMKMENEILAPRDGVVKQVLAPKGKSVMRGDTLIELD